MKDNSSPMVNNTDPMISKSETLSDTISLLLVGEAIILFQKKYEKMIDKSVFVEQCLLKMGRKPGFAITSQIVKNEPEIENIVDISNFLARKLSPIVFGNTSCTGQPFVKDNSIIIKYGPILPSIFGIFSSSSGDVDESQAQWFRCYMCFFSGVFEGSLLHFGYFGKSSLWRSSASSFVLTFDLIKLVDPWEPPSDFL